MQEDYRAIVKLCRYKIGSAKAQLELCLASAVKDNKKCFLKYFNCKWGIKENLTGCEGEHRDER